MVQNYATIKAKELSGEDKKDRRETVSVPSGLFCYSEYKLVMDLKAHI